MKCRRQPRKGYSVKRRPARILAGVPQTDVLITCANCGRPVHEADAKELGWRFYSDGVRELLPFCGLCIHREFRPDAQASTDD
jgi:hypothetical protein